MKKILLIGDSIRLGYDAYVRESMQKMAEVYAPNENCRFAAYVLRNIHYWTDQLQLEQVDAVHWNAGLWDTLRIYNDEPLTRPEVYADYIDRIARRITFLFPNAKTIFATTTPVIERGFISDFETRTNHDIEQYNQIACDVLSHHSVIINDLYALMKDVPEAFHSDQTHFYTAKATERIGDQVNHVLCTALTLDTTQLIVPDKSKYEQPQAKWDIERYVKKDHTYILAK